MMAYSIRRVRKALDAGLVSGLAVLACLLRVPVPARAQFTADYQTNIISGVASNWSGDYIVGSNTVFDQLQIVNGGVLTGAFINVVGYSVSGSNNSVVVSGTGSVWKSSNATHVGYYASGNSLTISSAGRVLSYGSIIGYFASSNAVLITGADSVWSNSASFILGGSSYSGRESQGNSIVVRNGAQAIILSGPFVSHTDYIGGSFSTNNRVLVTGAGSVWNDDGTLAVGSQSGRNSLAVEDGGKVLSSQAVVGLSSLGVTADSNTVVVSDVGSVWSNQGSFLIGDWRGTTNQVAFISRGNSLVVSNGGMVVVGSNMVVAPYNSVILNRGNLTVGAGLVISNNATLTATGTIYANLTLQGTLAPGNSAGVLTNFGNLTLQPSAVLQFELGGGSQGNEYDFILVTNGVATLNGLLRVSFINGFNCSVQNSDTFTLLTADLLTGSFTNVLSGQRLITADGTGSFLVEYSGDSLVLSDYQIIPEPTVWGLCVLGFLSLFLASRKGRLAHPTPEEGSSSSFH